MSITIEEAIAIARRYAVVRPAEEVPLDGALGRVMARDVFAPLAQPPFDRSPLTQTSRSQETAPRVTKLYP